MKTVSIFMRKLLPVLIFENSKIENFCKDKFTRIGKKSCENIAKINLRKKIQLFQTMEILPKKKILKLQPSNTFKMAYLPIKNFKLATGLTSHILDIHLIRGNMQFICYIYIVVVFS